MKISKLFHWLYAFLMFLPVFFVGGRLAYTIFNPNAKDSFYGNTQEAVDSVNVGNNLVTGHTYKLTSGYVTYTTSQSEVVYNVSNVIASFTSLANSQRVNTIRIRSQNSATYVLLYDGTTYVTDTNFASSSYNYVTFEYQSGNGVDLLSQYQTITEDIYNEDYYLDNAFLYSINQLNEVPLFSWAKDSFLVAPFAYIGNLFGVPSSSPINTLLSYWLDISIIWLVFDLIMYIPLLVHRWLDKGVLE